MKNLSTKEAIELVDSGKEISFEYIEKNVTILLQGDNESLSGEVLVEFITNFLKYSMQFDGNLEHATAYKYAIDNKVLKGFTLNKVISECRAIAIVEQP